MEPSSESSMTNVTTSPKAQRRKPITSADEVKVRLTFAEPTEEAYQALDEAVERIYRIGLSKGIF